MNPSADAPATPVPPRRWPRPAWVAGGLAGLMVLGVVVGETTGWPVLRQPMERAMTNGAGVPVVLQGDVKLHLIWRPRLAVGRLDTLDNQIDAATATYRLAVVELEAQGELPQFAECKMPEVLCMDPAPTWFRARVLDTLHGPSLPPRFHGATTSHYGPMQMASPQYGKPRLMLLMSDGDRHVMLRYANGFLAEDRQGFLHLVLVNSRPVWWLPCGAMDLKEPIHDAALAHASRTPLEHYREYMADERRDARQQGCRVAHAQCAHHPYCNAALQRVTKQGEDRRFLVAGAQYVGGAGVPRAVGSRIGESENSAGDDGEGDATECVADDESEGDA